MKKLLIASAIAAASLASVAMAAQTAAPQTSGFGVAKPFVAVTVGTNTNDEYATKNTANLLNEAIKATDLQSELTTISRKHAVIGGIQAGTDLYTVNSQVAFGAELDANYGFRAPYSGVKSSIASDKLQATRYSVNPMVYVTFSPIKQVTLKAKAGYGFQHLSLKETGGGSILADSFDFSNQKFHKWEPVLAAEAQYNVNSNIGVLVGDSYTFGKNWNDKFSAKKESDLMPRQNVVYAGLKYTF